MLEHHQSGWRPLSGEWRASPANDETRRQALTPGPHGEPWPVVSVPGHWQDEPGFEDHVGATLYRHRAEIEPLDPAARAWLVVDGALAQSEVFLDGSYLGPTDGYFTPHAFEVTDALGRAGDHDVVIEVSCPPPGDRSAKRVLTGCLQDSDIISPSWNPGGLWRVPSIEWTGPVRIDRLRVVCQEAAVNGAVLLFDAVLVSDVAREVDVVTLVDPAADTVGTGAAAAATTTVELAAGSNDVEWRLAVENPELWWPRSLGRQPLHDVRVEVRADGRRSHLRKRRTGIRRIELDDWVMRINGERLFLKGAMLHPSRRSLGSITPELIEGDLQLAVDAGLDLLRVATHVARPELYRRADELGLLLWQDLPMTRGMHRSTRSTAARQAVDLVDLLGHHPSIVMWCGHDDPTGRSATADVLADPTAFRRWKRRALTAQELPSWSRSVLDRSVARALRGADPSRPVLPHSGVLPHPPLSDGTDSSLWLGWERGNERDVTSLARRLPRLVRFMSGIGSQSVPHTADFCDPGPWPELDWSRLSEHHGLRKVQLERRVASDRHETFESWQLATQHSHADLVRRHVEQLRALKYGPTGGFIVETLVDPQAAISTALVDHERVPKEAYHALVDACRPVVAVASPVPAELRPRERLRLGISVVNDLRHGLSDVDVEVVVAEPERSTRWRWVGDIDADGVAAVGRIDHRLAEASGPLTVTVMLTAGPHRHRSIQTAVVVPL